MFLGLEEVGGWNQLFSDYPCSAPNVTNGLMVRAQFGVYAKGRANFAQFISITNSNFNQIRKSNNLNMSLFNNSNNNITIT